MARREDGAAFNVFVRANGSTISASCRISFLPR